MTSIKKIFRIDRDAKPIKSAFPLFQEVQDTQSSSQPLTDCFKSNQESFKLICQPLAQQNYEEDIVLLISKRRVQKADRKQSEFDEEEKEKELVSQTEQKRSNFKKPSKPKKYIEFHVISKSLSFSLNSTLCPS